MQALVDLIEKYRPGFAATVAPAPDEEIDLLEMYAAPLPGAYRRFLETMGGSMGDLKIDEATFKPMSLWNAYDQFEWLRRERFVLFAMDLGLGAWDYYLDREAPRAQDDALVVRMRLDEDFDPTQRMLVSAGLEEFLFYKSFAAVRLSMFEHTVRLRQPEDSARTGHCTPEAACALAEAQGFRRLPPATRCALYERGDAALLLYQHPFLPAFYFQVACDDTKEIHRIAEGFRRELGAVDQK
jgi:hypothetical protein